MRNWLVVLACLLTVGGYSTRVTRLDDVVRTPSGLESVTVLEEAPARPYTLIAVLEAKTETVFDDFDDLRRDMVKEAAELGGDAIILGPKDTDTSFIHTGIVMIRSDEHRLVGQVIVYKEWGAF
jgi:hypothetical protein